MAEWTPGGRCKFCGEEIDADQDYRKVVGFEKRRAQGGTNALRLREVADEWACRWCVDKETKGIGASQGSLL